MQGEEEGVGGGEAGAQLGMPQEHPLMGVKKRGRWSMPGLLVLMVGTQEAVEVAPAEEVEGVVGISAVPPEIAACPKEATSP